MDARKLIPLLRACVNSKSLKQGKVLHQKVVAFGFQNDVYLCKNLISLYVSCNLFDYAKNVFDAVENPFEISLWNGLMAGYTRIYMYDEALRLFDKLMCYPYLKPDSYTYPSVLKACGGLCRVVLGQMIHTCLVKEGLRVDIVVGSSLVGMYAKCNEFECAVKLFDEMPDKDVACWNTVISCYYQSGKFREALRYFGMMRRFGFEPDSVTITTAISSCARLLDLDRGREIHKELVNSGFRMDSFVSAALVDMYGKCGQLEMAIEVFEQMPNKTVVAWNSKVTAFHAFSFLRGCTVKESSQL
jgi:pentatricopeptide repeat protein